MSYDGRHHSVEIEGLTRELPLFEVAPGVKIAIFNMLGDTEIVEASARGLVKELPAAVETLIVPEVKAVPLGQAMSRLSGRPYVVVRKVCKPYMDNCLAADVTSITTGQPQTLYLDGKDRHLVQGKQVALLDDVISTGSTLEGLRQLVAEAEGHIAAELAVFTEGDAERWPDVIALGHLPVFSE